MPFGKYKGKPIQSINPKYLEWILPKITSYHVKQAILTEIADKTIKRAGKLNECGIKLDGKANR